MAVRLMNVIISVFGLLISTCFKVLIKQPCKSVMVAEVLNNLKGNVFVENVNNLEVLSIAISFVQVQKFRMDKRKVDLHLLKELNRSSQKVF